MIALEAKKMGYQVGILDADPACPAGQIADWQITKKYTDFDALTDFAAKSDVLTFESEAVDTMLLTQINPYIAIPQDPDSLSITQDRLIEKAFLESLNINVTPYATITAIEDMEEAVKSIGFPCVLKPLRIEMATPVQHLLYSEEDFERAAALLKKGRAFWRHGSHSRWNWPSRSNRTRTMCSRNSLSRKQSTGSKNW